MRSSWACCRFKSWFLFPSALFDAGVCEGDRSRWWRGCQGESDVDGVAWDDAVVEALCYHGREDQVPLGQFREPLYLIDGLHERVEIVAWTV